MKVYSLPPELPAPVIDCRNYVHHQVEAAYAAHRLALHDWLLEKGYTGALTGEVAKFQVADGYAQYMVGATTKATILVHLPYGDAYEYPHIERLTKKDIVQNVEANNRLNSIFANRGVL